MNIFELYSSNSEILSGGSFIEFRRLFPADRDLGINGLLSLTGDVGVDRARIEGICSPSELVQLLLLVSALESTTFKFLIAAILRPRVEGCTGFAFSIPQQ